MLSKNLKQNFSKWVKLTSRFWLITNYNSKFDAYGLVYGSFDIFINLG
jgi:hypothetical protein